MSQPNKFPGRCATCNTSVPAGLGALVRAGGRFTTYCEAHDPEAVVEAAPLPDLTNARTVWGANPTPVVGGLPALSASMTEEQREVIEFGDSEAVVAAVAGSGKTWALTQRCLRALHGGATPERVVVLAFNRKAADEFSERLVALHGPAVGRRFVVATFHAWAFRTLRSWYPGAPWLQTDRILDAGAMRKEPVLVRALARIGVKDQSATELDGWARVASRIANDLIDPMNADAVDKTADLFKVTDEHAARFVNFAASYTRAKEECGRIDFDDMLALVVRAIQGDTAHGRALATWYDHIMQDEAQDANRARWTILDALHRNAQGKTLVSVGDVRQSINGFAGARPDLLLARIAAGAKLLTLSTNWRSASRIVALSNAIARGRDWSVGGDARPAPGAEEGAVDVIEEVRAHTDVICDDIQCGLRDDPALVLNGKARYAVLTRTRALLAGIQLLLTSRQIPTRVIGGSLGIWGSPVGRTFLAYVRLATDTVISADDLLRTANTPTRYAKRDVTLGAHAQVNGQCDKLAWALRSGGSRGNDHLADDIEVLRVLAWGEQVQQIRDWLNAAFGTPPAGTDVQAAVDAADQTKMVEILCDLALSMSPAALNDLVREQERVEKIDERTPAVLLSTIHTFKGLEADTVFAPYLVEGVLPHVNGEEEEERRLWYVLATRARRRLVVLPFVAGREPSSFLTDAGILDEHGAVPRTEPVTLAALAAEQEVLAIESALVSAEVSAEAPLDTPISESGVPYAFLIPDSVRADAERDTAAAKPASADGHGSRSVPVHRSEVQAILVDGLGYTETVSAAQYTYMSPQVNGVRVLVYSSIPAGDDVARGVGDDSIRVVALYMRHDEKVRPVLAKNAYCCRTRGWRVTLLDRIQTTYDGIEALTPCPTCSAPMAHRDGKRGPFLGCCRYPLCTQTLPVAVPMAVPVVATAPDTDLPF